MVGLSRQIDIMLELNISAEQWFFLELVWIAQQENNAALMYKYFNERCLRHGQPEGVPQSLLQDLVDKKIIKYVGNGRKDIIDPDYYEIIEGSKWFIAINPQGYDFFKAYPNFSFGEKGTAYNLKNISSKFIDKDDFLRHYGKSIKYSKAEHAKNMDALNRAKSLGLVNTSIINWVASRQWENFTDGTSENI